MACGDYGDFKCRLTSTVWEDFQLDDGRSSQILLKLAQNRRLGRRTLAGRKDDDGVRARKRKAAGLSVIMMGDRLWPRSAVSDVVKEARLKVGRRTPTRSDRNVMGGWFHKGRIKAIEKIFEMSSKMPKIE